MCMKNTNENGKALHRPLLVFKVERRDWGLVPNLFLILTIKSRLKQS